MCFVWIYSISIWGKVVSLKFACYFVTFCIVVMCFFYKNGKHAHLVLTSGVGSFLLPQEGSS
jgi:hypothetical protein